MNQKGLAPILIVLILAALVGGYLVYQNQTKSPPPPQPTTQSSPSPADETVYTESDRSTNWKTYTDPTLAASFKYPAKWVLNPGIYGISTPTIKDYWYVYLSDPNYAPNCRGDCPVFAATFSVNNNDQNLDVVSYIKKNFSSITGGQGDFSQVKLENVTLENGLSFTKVIGFPGGNYYALYALHNNKIYIVGVGGGATGNDDINNPKVKQNLAIFDQILSTFRFD